MICVAKILQSLEMENLIKQNYRFYNKFIVSDFEKFGYNKKVIIDKQFILYKPYEELENSKKLVKTLDIIIE